MIICPIHEFNQNHEPAGTPVGGRFASTTGRPGANATIQTEAAAYNQDRGLGAIVHPYIEVDQTRAGRIADAYDTLPVDDSANPAVVRAYTALAQEVRQQWDHAVAAGMTFEPWTKAGQPYETSAEMAADVAKNRHLFYYTGGDPNPVMAKVDPDTKVSTNEMFRAIHDYYGHSAGGYGFGPRGEENAWLVHSQMFSREARRALTTETRGQNSWVNFGRQNYNVDGSYKNIPAPQRPFATQKMALLPEEFTEIPTMAKKTQESQPPFTRKPAPVRPEDELRYPRPPK